MKKRSDKHKIKKWLYRGMIIATILFLGTGVYAFYYLNKTMGQMYDPVDRISSDVKKELKPLDSKVYLLLGIDRNSRERNDIGRTDVIILAIVNDKTKKVTLTSIPRDTYVEIAEKGYKDKINGSYQYGLANSIATVENFTGIPIDNYILVNYDGVTRAVNAIGGLELYVDESLAEGVKREVPEMEFPDEGTHVLNGSQALYFARFRHDVKGDFGRNDRQQKVIKAFIDQGKEVRSPAKILKFLGAIGSGIKTDLQRDDIINLAAHYEDYTSGNIESIHYTATSDRFGPQNLWYVLISEEEQNRVTSLLKERINADEHTVLTDPTKDPNENNTDTEKQEHSS